MSNDGKSVGTWFWDEKIRERNAKLIDAVLSGTRIDEASSDAGIKVSTAVHILRYAGLRETATTLAGRMVIISELLRGDSQSDVARNNNISRQRVQQLKGEASAAGIQFPAKRGIKEGQAVGVTTSISPDFFLEEESGDTELRGESRE